MIRHHFVVIAISLQLSSIILLPRPIERRFRCRKKLGFYFLHILYKWIVYSASLWVRTNVLIKCSKVVDIIIMIQFFVFLPFSSAIRATITNFICSLLLSLIFFMFRVLIIPVHARLVRHWSSSGSFLILVQSGSSCLHAPRFFRSTEFVHERREENENILQQKAHGWPTVLRCRCKSNSNRWNQ